jgi:hypothetical protein
MSEMIRLAVHNQPPTRSQLEAWVKVDEALIRWYEARCRDQRIRILDLEEVIDGG